MSTTPGLDPTQQLPVIQDQSYNPHSGHGSVGPVIGVLAVIMVLGAVAVMIGRLCSGRRVMGHLQYDFEGWVETKCATCIDGRMGPSPRRQTVPPVVVVESNVPSNEAAATPVAAESPEVREDETPPHVEEVLSRQQPEQEHSKHEG
ncbi:hypothetical protein Hdeb2414_s0004g00129971 [Helianthus debilis subsp. tardiflorus]